MALKAQEAREAASKFARVGPALERIEAVDARLSAIPREARGLGGMLPKKEVTEKLVAFLNHHRGDFALRGAFSTISSRGVVQLARLEDLLAFLTWLVGPQQMEEWAKAAVEREQYQAGPSTQERVRQKAALDQEHAKLIEERERLVEEVRALGVGYEHLPETEARLQTDSTAARAEAVEADVLRRRQAELDGSHVLEREADEKLEVR